MRSAHAAAVDFGAGQVVSMLEAHPGSLTGWLAARRVEERGSGCEPADRARDAKQASRLVDWTQVAVEQDTRGWKSIGETATGWRAIVANTA